MATDWRLLSERTAARSCAITARDYENGGAMMQPYPGPWQAPAEGLVIYDVLGKTGHASSGSEEVSLRRPLEHKLYQLSPVRNGWAAVGRTDKYLCGATVEIISCDEDELTIRLPEAGPFAVYSAKGAPRAESVRFAEAGSGVYCAEMPIGPENIIALRR